MSRSVAVRVVFIITGLATGGAENMLLNLLSRFDRTNLHCHVISLTDMGVIGVRLAALGFTVEALGMNRRFPDPVRFLRLRRRLRQIKPEVVQTWLYHADLIGGLAARMAKIRTIIWGVRSADFLQGPVSFSTRLVVSLCTKASSWLPDRILYNSHKGRAHHEKIGYAARGAVVIPNGVDVETFRPNGQARQEVRAELGLSSTTPLIGFISRFDYLKNHEGFIQAAGLLHREMPAVHFVLAGQDVEWSNPVIKGAIERAGVTEVCHLLGRRTDIPRLTAALDVQGLTSWSEAFPNVLIEAMACGVPCVSTDVGDAAAILGDTGRVVRPGDMEGFAQACAELLRLSHDQRRCLGEQSRAKAITEFGLQAVVKQYEALYRGSVAWQA